MANNRHISFEWIMTSGSRLECRWREGEWSVVETWSPAPSGGVQRPERRLWLPHCAKKRFATPLWAAPAFASGLASRCSAFVVQPRLAPRWRVILAS